MAKRKADLKFLGKRVAGCTACEKGLVHIASIIMHQDEKALKKLALCDLHRALLIETVNEVFSESKDAEKISNI